MPWTEHDAKESTQFRHLFPYKALTSHARDDGGQAGDTRSLPAFTGPIPLASYHAYCVIKPLADATFLSLELSVPRAGVR